MIEQSELDRIHKLADDLTLALARQREVNETLVKALEAMKADHNLYALARNFQTCGCESCKQIDAALAAAREVK